MTALRIHPDRLFPAHERTRDIARALYASVAALPILSPHGHTDPLWFATDAPWSNATELLLAPDHYLYRMLYSQGVPLEALGVPANGVAPPGDPREAWRIFAAHQHLFRGTPSRIWLDHVFAEVFGFDTALDADTADVYFDRIGEALATPAFRPRALFDRVRHRAARNDRRCARNARSPCRDTRLGLAGTGDHHLSPGRRCRSRA